MHGKAAHTPGLNAAAFAFQPRNQADAALSESDDDEFSPFSARASAPQMPMATPPDPLAETQLASSDFTCEEIETLNAAQSETPFDTFCATYLSQHMHEFTTQESLRDAPRKVHEALERHHYDVEATVRSLQAVDVGESTHSAPANAAEGARVCRYFLAGECRRSDCRFSHDLNKALCRFWLREQCLNDPCLFLHDFDAFTALVASMSIKPAPEQPAKVVVPNAERRRLDPSETRWAAAAQQAPRTGRAVQKKTLEKPAPFVPRASARIALRPPTLLPTLSTGTKLAADMGKARAALQQNGKVDEQSWATIEALVRARHRPIREQLLAAAGDLGGWGGSAQASDEPGAQRTRGRWAGANLGLCLGVARQANLGKYAKHALSMDERTEAFLDMHGLHGAQAVQACEHFLLGLESESFRGLAYLGVGVGKHAGANVGKGKVATQVRAFLQEWGYPFTEYDGVLVCDPNTHL
ncbi:hypothetical protein MVES1_002339 [Malassezia vespertilionis]|uniref:Uncharacterized protein n=1 Tax=Malassezia vespertilionis TaxID=2020962 RepID=A0A2N1JCC8_9BASI|nr:uncharacterized protein MVES1_002339 [Malassezia vespertilionis]PKI84193.1 hypothetical protein MVES_002206 [Malassezia vespertilionis]WFD06984.1 hypothetical protein MVES1_002339 [Malassezia vespertilionis]